MRAGGVLLAMVALALGAGAARLAYIENTQGEELRRRAERQQTALRPIPAQRGEILDTRGRVLAGTIRRPSVFADPGLIWDREFAADSVAPVLGVNRGELARLLEEHKDERFVWVKHFLSEEEVQALQKLVRDRRLRAFEVQEEPVRVYPQGRLAPHILGFVGKDVQGLAGIELTCQKLLEGRDGSRMAIVDVGRRRVRARPDEFKPAIDGAAVVLTIDAYIQQIAENALRKAMDRHKPDWAIAVVLDPQSGEVLAMVSLPDFDPADPIPPKFNEMTERQQEAVKEKWRNRAVADSFEPGSAFKPFIASCALDEGVTRIDEVFAINGPVRDFGRRTVHDTHPYGSLALHEVISKSSNIGMGMLGGRCGMERLYRYVRLFGFGDVTGLGLPGEHTGLVQDFSRWNPSFSPQSVPIGQEIAVTPIQVVTAFSAFCNGGVLLRPRIIRGVIRPDGQTLLDYSRPIAIRRVLDAKTAETFRLQALAETVLTGTGKSAAVPGYQVFGKTGTAQIAQPNGHGYLAGKYIATFVGGAPARHPRVVVIVSIYKPTVGGYYGGVVSAPVVKDILADTLAYMQVPPELPTEPDDPRGMAAGRRPARPSAKEANHNDNSSGD